MSFETQISHLSLKSTLFKRLPETWHFNPKYPDNIMLHEPQILSSESEMTPEISGIWTSDGDIWVSDDFKKRSFEIWDLRFLILEAPKNLRFCHMCALFFTWTMWFFHNHHTPSSFSLSDPTLFLNQFHFVLTARSLYQIYYHVSALFLTMYMPLTCRGSM